jgi:protein-disulfide isomerase
MSRFVHVRHLGAIALLVVSAACARSEATPGKEKVTAAGGDVSAAPASSAGSGMASGLTDSISTRADQGRIRGADSAKVWVVEVSDFQCPYCKQWHDQTYEALDREYVQTGKVRLAYLNYPIASLHPNAHAASEAAMCASVQGKFWPLHTSLFTTQQKWAALANPAPFFDSLAVAAGADAAAYRSCISSHATVKLIEADMERSKAAGVASTPTFFIGDSKILGAYPLDTFRLKINEAIAKAKGAR